MFTPPTLDNCLPSLLPGVKDVDKDNKFLQDRVLDSMGPVAMLFECIYSFLAEAKPGENVILSYEQMKDLGAITSNAVHLLDNASALLSKERLKAVLNEINSKGTLSSLASEEFPQPGKSLFGEGFEARIKTRSETAKTLLSAASLGQNSRPAQFFPPPSEDKGTVGVVPVKGFQLPATSASFGVHSEAETELPGEPCSKSLQTPSREAFSFTTRYDVKSGTMLNLLAINHLPLAGCLKHCIFLTGRL